jgi:ketosteroid isomerase-like protein
MRTISRRSAATALPLAFAVVATACTFEVVDDEGTGLEASVAAMLERSAGAWNDGDLDAFVADYANATTTSFMTSDGPVYGPEQIRDRYASAFATGARRDSLRFEDLHVRRLPPLIGLATGRYILHRNDEVTSTGWFTLVLRRVGNGWRIIHDHSSASPLFDDADETESPE